MPNRHAPHSHVSPPPKQATPCHHCRKPITLQHRRPRHRCTELCHEHGLVHDYTHEPLQPVERHFDDQMREMCSDCALKPPERRERHVGQGVSGRAAHK